jgi:ABC-type glycerol-3-phosphate transport system permease component
MAISRTAGDAPPSVPASAESVPRRHRLTMIERADRRFATLMVLPTVIAVLAIMGYPWIYSGWMSLHTTNLLTRTTAWVGLGNYAKTFQNQTFQDSFIRTVWFSALVVVGGILVGLLIALVLNESFKGRGLMRSIMLMPWAIAPVVVGKLFLLIYSGEYGTLNGILYQFGLIDSYVPWLTESRRALIMTAIASIWQAAPLSALLLLAGLQSLPTNLYNAAKIDGASAWQRFRKITLPWLRPMLLLVVILNTINALMTFDLIYVLTMGGPGEATTVVSWLGYITFFNFARYGEGTAILYILSLISLVMAVFYFLILTRRQKAPAELGADAVARFDASAWSATAQTPAKREFREPLIPPKTARRLQRVLLYAAVVLIAVWSLLPFYVMLNASLSTTNGILSRPPHWFPNPVTLENYRAAIFGEQVKGGEPNIQAKAIVISMKNSMIVALSVTLVNLLIGGPAGYAFSRYQRYRGVSSAFWLLMLTRMIPPLTLAVPFFIIFRRMGLIDTKTGLVIALTSVILPLTVWILKGYFDTLPPNLEKAATVDGCTRFQAFQKVVIPIAIPGLVAAGIFCFLVAWNEFVYAILLTSTLNSQTLPTRIAQFVSDQRIYNPGLLFAAGALAVLPPVLITLLFQRYLLRGMTAGAIKG